MAPPHPAQSQASVGERLATLEAEVEHLKELSGAVSGLGQTVAVLNSTVDGLKGALEKFHGLSDTVAALKGRMTVWGAILTIVGTGAVELLWKLFTGGKG